MANEPVVPKPSELLPIINAALNKNFNAETFTQLLAAHEKAEAEYRQCLYQNAMLEAQKGMPMVVEDQANSKTGSGYASLGAIQLICKPVLANCGFVLSFSEQDSPIPNHKRTEVLVMHSAGHRERHHVDLLVDGVGPSGKPMAMNPIQGEVSTMSYGRRVLLTMVFDIVIVGKGQDDDGQSFSRISREQVNTIRKLLDELKPSESTMKRFLAFAKCDEVEEMPAYMFDDAERRLREKIKERNLEKTA